MSVSTWNIDPTHSHAEFKVRHLMISNVKGSFPKVAGVLTLEDADPAKSNPVSVSIFPDSISLPFGYLTNRRSEAELARLAVLARELPGVAPYLQDLEARKYRQWRGMPPDEILSSDDALDAWKRMLLQATAATSTD